MRIFALAILLAPTLAVAKPHAHAKAQADTAVSAPTTSAPTASRGAMVEQADDDERPGQRTAKKR